MLQHLLQLRCTDLLRQYLGDVNGVAAGVLRDLFAATEAVGDDNRGRIGRAHGRQKDALAKRLRDLIFVALKAERPGHSAAA